VGKLAVVTGASSGIGEAYAARLAAGGWDLIVVARRQDRLEGLAARLRDRHANESNVFACDLADPEQRDELCAQLQNMPVEMLLNNAALAHYKPKLCPRRSP
jgi:short-subunit dehydrogenase